MNPVASEFIVERLFQKIWNKILSKKYKMSLENIELLALTVYNELHDSSCRSAVILLGLLCLLLLIGLITLVFLCEYNMNVVSMLKCSQVMYSFYDDVSNSHPRQISVENGDSDTTQALRQRDQREKPVTDQLQQSENWVVYSDSLYQVSSEKKSWEESRRDCLQKGADLMIINSREEQNFVNQFKKHLWIGLTDSQTEGTWKWVDGTQVNTSYWNQKHREPNGGRKENCGEIDNYNAEDSWNDAPCSNGQFWICEKRVSP
ncbi:myosin heavy chain 1/2/3/4/8/13/7B/15 [Sarotherodon galilaeus]